MSRLSRLWRRSVASTRNVLELARVGRLGQPYGAPHEVIDVGPHHRLRRYATCPDDDAPPALLVPPLMVTSEVYDIEEDLSAVAALGRMGVAPYVVDFGAPEREEGGMARTLDDHVLAVVRSVERVRKATGRDVHLMGYSQGGMFAYQTAAYLRSEGIRSVVTFGSPVDIHRGLPAVHGETAAAILRVVEPLVSKGLERIEGLPGTLTSTAFKMVSPRKEAQSRLDFVRKLHDRGALERREARRRFLGGEGFVAWPGPAFRAFVDQFILHNRMLSGGFVLSGRTVTLADITCPILAFIGKTDDMARPATVKAVARAAPEAEVHFTTVEAGHFGLVVGSRAMKATWPTVAAWVKWREGAGPMPSALAPPAQAERARRGIDDEPEGAAFEIDVDVKLAIDAAVDTVRAAWRRAGDVTASASDALDSVRYQEPRLRRLGSMTPSTRTSPSLWLAEAARESPEGTFFLWQDRAFTYREADARVGHVARGLHACGVRRKDRVGVVMGSRPSFLSLVTALIRLGAVPIVAPPDAPGPEIRRALSAAGAEKTVMDPQHLARLGGVLAGKTLVLGGGGKPRALGDGVVDMEAIDTSAVDLPAGAEIDGGLARDLAMILLRPSETGELRAAPITNHRWALSALGAAAACTLKPDDTVYSAIPLHHPTGILVGVGAALAGGARLALAARFDPDRFFSEARRYGATIVVYAGEMLRPLVHRPPGKGDRTHSIRLFAGSGIREDLSRKLRERYGAGVMEFYASTTHKVIMANASGEKVGALGRALPGSAATEVVRCELPSGKLIRDAGGALVRCAPGEAGLLVAGLDADEGSVGADDRYYVSSDVVRRDADGDTWFVDALSGFVATPGGPVSTRRVEDALYRMLPEVEIAAAFGDAGDAGTELRAAVVAREPIEAARIEGALASLAPHERPAKVVQVDALPLTEGFRPSKRVAREVVRAAFAARIRDAGASA